MHKYKFVVMVGLCVTLWSFAATTFAATLTVSPSTGVYTTGATFSVRVVVNTQGSAINAADGTLSFNPQELQVVSVSRGSSIFNLWTSEPSFSNSAGTVAFSGGSPTGYTGNGGTVMSVTFRTVAAGTARITLTGGSVLAADGRGTNVLTSMGNGSYTISAASVTPTPEAIVEFVPPANTPGTPVVTSTTHQADGWSQNTTARLSWNLPAGVTGVRTLLDQNPTSVPTRVYDTPIRDITLPDLPVGISYFHIQFRNEEGWGRVAHYRLAVDTTAPTNFGVALTGSSKNNATQTVVATTSDSTGAPITRYEVTVGSQPMYEIVATRTNEIAVNNLAIGENAVTIVAIDAAGNRAESRLTITREALPSPRFKDLPARIASGITPVLFGEAIGGALVTATLRHADGLTLTATATADVDGNFRLIPEERLPDGVYELTAFVTTDVGGVSEPSPVISLIVEPPLLVQAGSTAVLYLSVLIPLIALIAALILGTLYFWRRYRRFVMVVGKESTEVELVLHQEFTKMRQVIADYEASLAEIKRTKKASELEDALLRDLTTVLNRAESVVTKEAKDVEDLVK